MLPTREFENGQWVTQNAAFRVYHNVAESIADHSQLLATGTSYQQAMADRHLPDAFATDLTGVYATDPQYGSNLIAIMRLYNLYRYDAAAPAAAGRPGQHTAVQGGIVDLGGTASQAGGADRQPGRGDNSRGARRLHDAAGPDPRRHAGSWPANPADGSASWAKGHPAPDAGGRPARPVRAADPAGRDDRLHHLGEGATEPGRAAL